MAQCVLYQWVRRKLVKRAAIRGGRVMRENKKKWMELCEQAADEQDPKKLAALILEINFMLEAEELRLIRRVVIQPPVEDTLTAD